MNDTTVNTILLVIDVQQGLFEKSTPIYRAETLLRNIAMLAERAHAAGTPVIYVQHSDEKNLIEGSRAWQLHAELRPAQEDTLIHKRHGNAFEETPLDDLLKSRAIARVVVMGLVTHGCVKATCIGAKELGYSVVLVADGHSNYSKDAAKIIEKWNTELSKETISLVSAADVVFG